MKKYLHFSRFLVLLVGLLTISANSAWGDTWAKVTSTDQVVDGGIYAIITNGDSYYIASNNPNSSAPTATTVTKNGSTINFVDAMKWKVTKEGSGFVFESFSNSGVYLWGGSANDGVRVNETSAKAGATKVWYPEFDNSYGVVLYNKATTDNHYLEVYNATDWRNYTSKTQGTIGVLYVCNSVTYTDYLTECESCDPVGEELSVTAAATTLTIGSNDKASTTLSTSGGNNGTITFSVTPDGTATISGNSITFTAAGTYTVIASQDKTDGKCSQRATVDITVNPRQYTLTFVDRGNTHDTQQHKAGEKATKPDDPTGVCTEPTEYVFDGWTENTVNAENEYTKVDFNTYTMPAKDTQLYAVYRYADDGSGSANMFYLSETSGSTMYYIGSYYASGKYFNAVTNISDAIPLGIEDGKYLYTNIAGVKTYITHTSSGETDLSTSTTAPTPWTITDNGTTIKLQSTTQTTRYLGYGTGFKAYAASHTLTKTAAALYTTSPACGPHIGLSGDVRITSAKDMRVDAYTKITVSGTNLDKNEHSAAVSIKAESNNAKFKIKRWGENGDGNDASNGKSWSLATNIQTATYTDSLCITYTPTEFNAFDTATITLTAYRYNGTTPYATKTITVLGHSLPERFVIAAKKGTDGWVALPNTLGSNSSALVPSAEDIKGDVDPTDNPTKLNTAPSNVIYKAAARGDSYKNNSQTGLRFTVDGGQFLQASKNETKVWLSTTGSQDMQSWTLRTEDFTDYVVRLDSGSRYNRSLSYYKDATTERIGHYTTNTAIRFLPFDTECTRLLEPANLKVTQVKSSAITLAWDAVTGAIGYAYSTDSGTNWTEMGNVLTYIITGLTAETPYTIWVKGVVPVGDTDCSYYGTVSATTTNCDDVPYDISYTSDVNSITLSWTMTAKTATVRVYSNDAGTTQVGSFEGKSSPYKITGLTKATTYYVKILADGLCPSELVEVSTERPQLDVVEWKTDGIDVAINTNEKISVVLENQVTKGSGTGLIADELFFSKYFEATGNVKLVAVYNGTGHDVDVTNYTIKYGKTGWESGYIKLGNFTKVQNTMAAGEEVILYSKGNADEDNVIMDCVSTAYPGAPWQQVTNGKSGNSGGNGLLSFAGDKTIALYNGTTLLDVIGAITAGGSPTNTGTSMKIPSWGDAKGWTCDTGLSIEDGTEIGISTNRCLLVRKNTVKSGANAVTRNTADFATLCDEWLGQHVPDNDADNGVQASCDNFAYVGTFDYSGYYTTYDSLVSVEFDNSKRNPDGTLTIEIPRMDTLACKGLKIIAADEGGNVLTTKDYKVPILVTRNATTADNTFFHFGGDTCKTCDVVIRNNATLTKAADGKDQVRDVMVYEGSSLKVNGGTSFTVNSLSLRRKEDVVSTMDVDVAGTLNINSTSDKPVYLDMRITAENWHWFTLPYDCAISDVTWSNGQPAKYGTEWFLMYYDGARRATGVDSGNWKEYEGTTIAAGQGFIIGIKGDGNDKHAYELRFPMAKEVITNDGTDKKVEVYAYGAGTEARPNHKGWNLVGNPYLNYYQKGNINSFNGLRLGLLDYDTDTGWWSVSATDNSNPYIVIPQDFGWSAYKQVLVSSQDLLPFTSYFIQVGKDEGYDDGQKCEVQFDKDKRGKSPKAALMKSAAEEAEEEPVITGIVLRNAQGEQDETSLVIAERFGSSYEMGADFFKWFGDYYKYYTLPVLYSIGDDGGKRAFNAVNEEGAKQSIPLGMYAARDGQYTFSLNTRSDLSRVDKVWLYDAESGCYTDLLREDYTFATTRTEGSGRFFLSVALKEKEITTSAANARYGDLSLYADKQTLIVRGLPEEAEVWVYDPSGKLLHHEQTRHYERQYEVPQQGTYLVRVESQDGGVTLRGVCR